MQKDVYLLFLFYVFPQTSANLQLCFSVVSFGTFQTLGAKFKFFHHAAKQDDIWCSFFGHHLISCKMAVIKKKSKIGLLTSVRESLSGSSSVYKSEVIVYSFLDYLKMYQLFNCVGHNVYRLLNESM